MNQNKICNMGILCLLSEATKRLITTGMPLIFIVGSIALSGCVKRSVVNPLDDKNVVVNDPNSDRVIGDKNTKFAVMGEKALTTAVNQSRVRPLSDPDAQLFIKDWLTHIPELEIKESLGHLTTAKDSSLTLGFPLGLLGERQIFGGVITKVTDKENESLGNLKLSDLPPVHVRAVLIKTMNNNYKMALMGCADNCNESSQEESLLTLPAVGVDEEKKLVMIDLAAVGEHLNLIYMLDPQGNHTNLKTKTNKAVEVDYTYSTLVFDVETTMIPVSASDDDATAKETTFTTRWYLKLGSAFNPSFEPRSATKGIGYFLTERASNPRIQRHAIAASYSDIEPSDDLHYYILNVPKEYREGFKSAFDEWNATFRRIINRDLIQYEFVEPESPKAKRLVAGDIRYNIVLWDDANKAAYAGFGPAISNQFTGEILSSNVLVQGISVIEIYKEWFDANHKANELKARGQYDEAESVLARAEKKITKDQESASLPKVRFALNSKLSFRVNSQRPELEDPIMAGGSFDPIPNGVTFESYMAGFFHDAVTHELGHNLGLRHNFRGSLYAADGEPTLGKVSASIMEYLGRSHRYLDRVGEYDLAAIKYGYLGITPTRTDQFCTDEDQVSPSKPNNSAECNKADATNDPFSYFERRLSRSIDLLVARGQSITPDWVFLELRGQVGVILSGMLSYAASAEATASSWTNFFKKLDRPEKASDVENYVVQKLKAQLCDSSISDTLNIKESEEAKKVVLDNIDALRTFSKTLMGYYHLSSESIKCD